VLGVLGRAESEWAGALRACLTGQGGLSELISSVSLGSAGGLSSTFSFNR
jgi:hypothetical protein